MVGIGPHPNIERLSMKKVIDFLKGKKTYIIAVLMAAVAVCHVLSGEMSLMDFLHSEALNNLLSAFGLATLRAGIGTQKEKS